MHELSVTESILQIALRHARLAHANRISHLHLVVGEMSSIVDDSVQFYWDFVSKDTIAEGAKLHFRRVAAKMQCLDCEGHYVPGTNLACPACGSHQVRVVAGEEFYLEAIDVEETAVAEPHLQEI